MSERAPTAAGRAACLAAILLVALAGATSSSAAGRSPASSAAHAFVDLVPALPADLDESATPEPAQSAIVPSWSSGLVRPRGAPPGPHAILPGADAVVPYLATSWQSSPGGDYTFRLRHGVRSASGDPFTAADVRWSIERALAVSPAAPFLFSLANLDRRDPVTILGRYAVRINVTAPSPFLLGVLASFEAGIYDRRAYLAHASAGDPWAVHWGVTHSVTFGAYSVAEFKVSHRIVLQANPHSWLHPYYTTVYIEQVASSSDRLRRLLDGSAEHTSGLDWADFELAGTDARIDHLHANILQSGPAVESWLIDLHGGPLAKLAVRRALSLAINRTELNGVVYDGYAAPDSLALPAIEGESQPPASYDQARARELLASAGYPNGFTLDVDVASGAIGDGSESLELRTLTSQLAQVGITLVPAVIADSDQLLALEAAHRVPSAIEEIDPLLGGAAFTLIEDDGAALDPVSPAADDGYRDRALTALLERLRTTAPGPAANELVARAEQLVNRDVPLINLLATPVENVTSAAITGYAAYAVPVTYYELLHPSGRA